MNMKQNDLSDHVTIRINEKLARLSPSPSACIFRLHNQLREVNKKAYEPEVISVGPYHHGKDELKVMQEHKLRYLHFRLQHKNENVERYVSAMRLLEAKARTCYAETLNLDTDEFLEMMLLDGFFIIELFRKFESLYLREKNDPIYRMDWIVISLQRDLMLFENQLPFFVLCELFDMIEVPNQRKRLIYLALRFFRDLFPGLGDRVYCDGDQQDKIHHLLGLVNYNWLPSCAGTDPNADKMEKKRRRRFIHCATELIEAGVKFEKIDKGSLFDINFKHGIMQIPAFTIEDRTECVFRNLMAYEQYNYDTRFNFVNDYVTFITCLINSPKDVEILCQCGIIENFLGNDEAVSSIFSKITDSVTGPDKHFYYAEILEKVNAHCDRRANRWMATLRRNYLNGPWAIISVFAGFVLLVLTFLQTVFTVKN